MHIELKLTASQKAAFADPEFPIAYAVSDDGIDIWLHGAVGDEFAETDSASVGQMLSKNRGMTVTLRVNSPGGLAYDGVAIFNSLQAHDGATRAVIEGLAGSAASLAAVGCDTVDCYSGAVFHPHYSLVMAMGHQAEIREALAIQERLDQDLEQIYASVSGQTIAEVQRDLLGPNGDGTRFSAAEAQAAGYVDNVLSHKKAKPAPQSAANMDRVRLARARNRQLRAVLTHNVDQVR